jgi:hypothetical protein
MIDWRKIAGDLYDELSVRGLNGGYADCIFRHSLSGSDTKDCLLAFELAELQEALEKEQMPNEDFVRELIGDEAFDTIRNNKKTVKEMINE